MFVGFLGVPALTGDSRGCFVDFAPVILSTTPETISGVAGAKTALGGLSYRTEKKEVEEIHVGETFDILKIINHCIFIMNNIVICLVNPKK